MGYVSFREGNFHDPCRFIFLFWISGVQVQPLYRVTVVLRCGQPPGRVSSPKSGFSPQILKGKRLILRQPPLKKKQVFTQTSTLFSISFQNFPADFFKDSKRIPVVFRNLQGFFQLAIGLHLLQGALSKSSSRSPQGPIQQGARRVAL